MAQPDHPYPAADRTAGGFVDLDGERYYRISGYDAMEPFFMSVVSPSDHWLFLSSTGGLTAGRREPDNALFPYYTDDRIHDAGTTTGSLTILRVERGGTESLWEPFSDRQEGVHRLSRALYKSETGTRVVVEEVNHDLELAFRCSWSTSERFGFVRGSELRNLGGSPVEVRVLDGIRNVLPSGVTRRFQLEYSTLVDGYKRTELVEGTRLALFRLSSIPVDNAEPSEALRVNAAWAAGLDRFEVLLSTVQCDRFRRGEDVRQETDVRGRRGAYLVATTLALEPGASRDWLISADVELDASAVRALLREVAAVDAHQRVLDDVADGTRRLVDVVGRADGLQATGLETSTARHFANALFNIMRGGVPADGLTIETEDLVRYIRRANGPLADRRASFLAALPARLDRMALMALAAEDGDPDLERLCAEYLPLTFSRRHGDPSRPWNAFAIRLKDEQGRPMLDYQGNWRDIFQNWEALALSYPRFLESMLFKFADSSTLDGYNPYRVMRDGYEWERLDPDDDWAFIGYWGDHQVIYLQRLLEAAERYRPGSLGALMTRRIFTFADVPYRIRPYAELVRNPRDTIVFDTEVEDAALARAAAVGSDGKAAVDAAGDLVRATLVEKLLIVSLTKLSNLVPGAGIWMNTQRPEWNDANNALVGNGVSMVTACYLRRHLAFLDVQLAGSGLGEVELSAALADLLGDVTSALVSHPAPAGGRVSDAERKALVDLLGAAGERYRERVYDPASRGMPRPVAVAEVRRMVAAALEHLDRTIAAGRRDDGLFDAYSVMSISEDGIAVSGLDVMLEGQVAALSAGVLGPEEVADVLDVLRSSALYRPDQDSYLLYPDRELPHFLDKNVVPPASARSSRLLSAMIERGDERIVTVDVEGDVHFNAAFRNAAILERALDAIDDRDYDGLVGADRDRVLAAYEEVFRHASFTGRSGTFYKYEGLGSIYWHMVSKLLLAVDEALLRALAEGAGPEVVDRLARHYEEIRAGIGADKSPAAYGAVPTDPYSHTPGFAGVQQPGMTGQVKEDLITRMSEMGLLVREGCLGFLAERVRASEMLAAPASFEHVDVAGERRRIGLDAGTMAFTVCQVPVILHRDGPPSITVRRGDAVETLPGLELPADVSASIFDRDGEVTRLDVALGLA